MDKEQLMLLRRALEIYEERTRRLLHRCTHESIAAIYRKDLVAIEKVRLSLEVV
jgi:hypothetical protein